MTIELDKFDVRAEISIGGGESEWQKLGENLSDLENADGTILRYRVLAYYKNTDMMAVKEFSEIPDLQTLENEFTAIAPVINKFRVKGNPYRLE